MLAFFTKNDINESNILINIKKMKKSNESKNWKMFS